MKLNKGFTLLEISITLLVVFILSTISVVYYQHQVTQSRRVEAKIALLDLAGRLEAYQFENLTYLGATPPGLGVATTTENHDYTLEITDAGSDAYIITATPSFSDSACGTFTLNSQGVRGVTGSEGATDCWTA